MPESTIKLTFEGSPSDIQKVLRQVLEATNTEENEAYNVSTALSEELGSNAEIDAIAGDGDPVSVETARHYFERRPISDEQKIVFIKLYEAQGEAVPTSDLKDALEYTGSQMRGLLGSLGKRRKETKGYQKGQIVLEKRWDAERAENFYKLPNTVRQAMIESDVFPEVNE